MDTRQLEYFVAVAEELSFTRAAQRVFAVQSTVSAAVRSLEAELGTRLFDRSTRRVALSAAGTAFLPEAKAAIEAVERARATVQEASEGLRGSLRIGTLTSVGGVDLPALLGAFHRRYPLVDIHVTVSITGSTGLADEVRQGRLDVALVGLPESDLAGLDVLRLDTRPFVVVLPATHRLAARKAVRLADLAGEAFIDTPRGFGNRVLLDRAFDALGSPRRVTVEVADLRPVPGYVRAGLGVAVVPDTSVPAGSDVVVRPLAGAGLDWPLNLVTAGAKPPSRALRTLLDLVESSI
ncbi:LysR family transcriptional regulator [Amycolatopsis sp. SID8362]|uniref:LysR family transcriptional regulator n=1 Tax=Amycolatopsis sp. SID8362 TaxID=2690346 RepID=UPI00136CEDD6|nr:LysR family transcriptional regulator [Amycolatopsis sp. SID8362]NBH03828.1 LysR family transcriptional regulator [Amycolatopsis sp. SID8362]NED40528.1 LysR family transcriptional regulator [Amycolatopsis sp. SID8362]